jgi:hypothetical protein
LVRDLHRGEGESEADRTVTCAVFRFTGASTRGSVRGAKK